VRASAQHAASLKAITARQLQARVEQRPAVIQSSVAAAVGTSNQVGGRKRPDNPGGKADTKPDCPACTETPSRHLPNVRERDAYLLLLVADAHKCVSPEHRMLEDKLPPVRAHDAERPWLLSREYDLWGDALCMPRQTGRAQ